MTWTLQMYKPSSECKLKHPSPPPPHKFLHKTTSFQTPVRREYVISLANGPHLFPCQSSIFLISIRLSGKICPVLQNLHPPVPRKERGRTGTKRGEREVWDQTHMMEYHIGGHTKCTNKSSSESVGQIRQNYIQST